MIVKPTARHGEIVIGQAPVEHHPIVIIDSKTNDAIHMTSDELAWLIHTGGPAALAAHASPSNRNQQEINA